MDFKQYYRNKMNEEGFGGGPLDPDAPAQPQAQRQPMGVAQQAPKSNGGVCISSYLSKDKNLKSSLSEFGKAVGDAIVDFAVSQLVAEDDFENEKEKNDYMNSIRDKVTEGYNKTLIELMRNIGIYIDNTKNSITK